MMAGSRHSSTVSKGSRLAFHLKREKGLNPALRAALDSVSRSEFLDLSMKSHANDDTSLPIGFSQTTSQPTVIVKMLNLLLQADRPRDSVLEVGSGCGYQTALLAEMYENVFAVERIKALAQMTRDNLRRLGYNNARVKHADGIGGLQEVGELDGIIVSAAAEEAPEALIKQLGIGARLVAPLEIEHNVTKIAVVEKRRNGETVRADYDHVAFVPLLKGLRG